MGAGTETTGLDEGKLSAYPERQQEEEDDDEEAGSRALAPSSAAC
jgi:hypothetical protein